MREIKFRGQRKTDFLWVFGSLYINKNGDPFIDIDDWKREPVDKNSVGQSTELKDKNGKEIWEGDVLEYSDHSGILGDVKFGQVTFHEYISFCDCSGEDVDIETVGFFIDARQKLNKCFGVTSAYYVVGNIYENPELLKDNS